MYSTRMAAPACALEACVTIVNSGYVLAIFQRGNGCAAYIAPARTGNFKLVTAMRGVVRIFSRRGFPDKLLLHL